MAIEGDTRQYMAIQCTCLNTLRYMEINTLGHSQSLQLCIARNGRCPADVLQLKGGFSAYDGYAYRAIMQLSEFYRTSGRDKVVLDQVIYTLRSINNMTLSP